MFDIIVISHGSFSCSLLETAELIAGKQSNVKTLGVDLGCNLDEVKNELIAYLTESKNNNRDVLILSDLFFGSPFTLVCSLMEDFEFKHYSGINLPTFLEILTQRHCLSLDEILENLLIIAQSSIIDVNSYFCEEGV
ncbi:MAG: PTS sugar transporter subunit IIA [Erysipelotrichaceae bacterium]|nr:PTS sugar transporter subunit IIA [Erysipelotrichaceae bacterium]